VSEPRGSGPGAPARASRRARKSAPEPVAAFAPQKAAASEKELVLFEIERARVAVKAALQGLGAGANRPVAPGKWTPREIVLHLAARDRVRLDEFAAIRGGTPPSWAHLDTAGMSAVNAGHLAALAAVSWDDAVRLLERTRAELLAALLAVPAEPADVWSAEHPFGRTMCALAPHDRKHAEQIKNARIAG
jgi:hypothetical protein